MGVLKTTSVVWEGFNESANKKLPEKLKPRPELEVSINDILITRAGPTSRVGVTVHVDKVRAKLMLPDKLIRIRSNENTSSLFLAISLGNSVVQKQLVSKSSGLAESQTNISQKILLNTQISFPNLPEQQKIASFLSAVDEKIQQLSRKKELLEQYKKGVMQQLFSGKLRFKDENGEEFPDWEEKKLGDVGAIISGLTYSPTDINEDGILVLRSSNVQNRRLSFRDNVYVKTSAFNPVELNDILICVRNGSKHLIGKNAIIDKETAGVAFGAFMSVYRSNHNLFIFHYFDTDEYKNEVHKNLGATINSINGSDLKKFKIPFPSLEEQQKIANFLSGIDGKIENVNGEL